MHDLFYFFHHGTSFFDLDSVSHLTTETKQFQIGGICKAVSVIGACGLASNMIIDQAEKILQKQQLEERNLYGFCAGDRLQITVEIPVSFPLLS